MADPFPLSNNSTYWDNVINSSNTPPITTSDAYISLFGTTAVNLVGVEEISSNLGFNIGIYPNPTNGQFTITFNIEEKQRVQISVYNLLGEKIAGADLGEKEGLFNWNADLSAVANGIYIVQVAVGDQTLSKKVKK